MAYISFQHKDTITNPLRRAIMAGGSGGDYVHCEIVLNEMGFVVCSSWYPQGVEIRAWENKKNPGKWANYDIGSADAELFEFFTSKSGTRYTLGGLVLNMMLNAQEISKRSFCSQICYEAMRSVGHYDLPQVVATSLSPQNLKNIIDSHNFKQIQ